MVRANCRCLRQPWWQFVANWRISCLWEEKGFALGAPDTESALGKLKLDPFITDESSPAELITTHISWVLRGPNKVIKLKRPVHYEFLDFSTLHARHTACLEELRVNQSLAPDVYGGLLTLSWDGGQPTFGEKGKVMDYAVLMRRLADEGAASVRLAEGRLSLAHIEALAQRLAAFYKAAPRVDAAAEPETVARLFLRNFDELHHLQADGVTHAQIAEVRERAISCLKALRDRLEHRLQIGASCDGHGDLRLEHVYFEGPSLLPIVIDAVEFNTAFRCGDRALDAAFFAMELELAGSPDVAAWFWSCLARSLNDYSFYPLIDLYVMYRASVRAKVAAITGMATDAPAEKRAKKQRESVALWDLARRAALGLHAGSPSVVCVGGVVGAGKSFLADTLGPHLYGAVVSSDRMRKALAGLAPTQRARAEHYTEAFSQRTLQAMLGAAQDVLASGRTVVLDATFRTASWRSAFAQLASKHHAPFLFVQAHCSDEIIRERLRARATEPSVSDAREEQLDSISKQFEAPTELATREHLVANTEGSLADVLAQVRQRLSSWVPN